jgi:hypothetical protein
MKATLPTRTPTPSIAIVVSYVPPTNTKGSRVKVEIPRMKVKRIFSLDHAFNSCSDQVESWLYSLEIECMAQAELKDSHVFLVGFNYWEKLNNAFGKIY